MSQFDVVLKHESGRGELREGYPVCSGGFGGAWHEPRNMRIYSVDVIGSEHFPMGQRELWVCPECGQEFRCEAPVRPTK